MLSRDPNERLACVLVNLGLADSIAVGSLTFADVAMVVRTIRSGDEWGAVHGDTPFPHSDEWIVGKLAEVCRVQAQKAKES